MTEMHVLSSIQTISSRTITADLDRTAHTALAVALQQVFLALVYWHVEDSLYEQIEEKVEYGQSV